MLVQFILIFIATRKMRAVHANAVSRSREAWVMFGFRKGKKEPWYRGLDEQTFSLSITILHPNIELYFRNSFSVAKLYVNIVPYIM